MKIPFELKPGLVRGLDYYNKTVFEIVSEDLGSQNSVGGGGRFDGLLKTLGGPDLPCTGFATGIERIIQTLLIQKAPLPEKNRPALFLIALGPEAVQACFQIMHQLRKKGIPVQMDFTGKKLNKVMQYADQINAKYVAVVGDEELKKQTVELKEMATGEKTSAPLFQLERSHLHV